MRAPSSYIGNVLRSGTRESFTRVSSGLIVVSGVLGFLTLVVYIFFNKDLSGYEIAALIAADTAYTALGVTGKYYGTKLEVQGTVPQYPSQYPGQYGGDGLINISPENQSSVEQFKTE